MCSGQRATHARSRSARLPGVGPGLPGALAGHVRAGHLEGVGKAVAFGPGPAGHQATLLPAAGRRALLRLGAESHPSLPGGCAPHRSGGPALLPEFELRSRRLHAGGRYRETETWPVAGVARRLGHQRRLLEPRVPPAVELDHGSGQRGARFPADGIGPRAFGFRRAPGRVVQRRPGLFHHPALCGSGRAGAHEDVLGLLPGPQL